MADEPTAIRQAGERLMRRLDMTEHCWLWTGPTDRHGYGVASVARKAYRTHRLSYEHNVGKIPPGHVIDHVCRTPLCCRPDHLRAVTVSDNTRAGLLGFELTGMCRSGRHDMSDPANVKHRSDGHRQCYPCKRELDKKRWAK